MNRQFMVSVCLLICACMGVSTSQAGIQWIEVGISGLTCSVCSRSVELRIRKLEFVDHVVTDLAKTESRVYLKPGVQADLRKIAGAVVAAGFSVRFLKVALSFEGVTVSKDGRFTLQGQAFRWLGFQGYPAHDEVMLKLVDQEFLPREETRQWKDEISTSGSARQNMVHAVPEAS